MNAKTRLGWIRLYEQLGDAGLVCRRCGISRPTLRKWWRRYRAEGIAGLEEHSRRPHRTAGRKIFAEQETLILEVRRTRQLGIKQLRNELLRDHSRPVPGDRVQIDVCKIAPALYQYTAIDDCSRWKVLGLYPRRSATSTLGFLGRLLEEMPFPIQRLQTDQGLEFFAEAVQRRLMGWGIKFRHIKPRSPHLNGKVERTQRTDLEEFWATVDPKSSDLRQRLDEWQHFWNWHRPHTALGGRSPIDRVCELTAITPSADAVDAAYDPAKERIRVASYVTDKTLSRVK